MPAGIVVRAHSSTAWASFDVKEQKPAFTGVGISSTLGIPAHEPLVAVGPDHRAAIRSTEGQASERVSYLPNPIAGFKQSQTRLLFIPGRVSTADGLLCQS